MKDAESVCLPSPGKLLSSSFVKHMGVDVDAGRPQLIVSCERPKRPGKATKNQFVHVNDENNNEYSWKVHVNLNMFFFFVLSSL